MIQNERANGDSVPCGVASSTLGSHLADDGFTKEARLAALDRLDVESATAIPMRAEPVATRCGEMVE